jgi:hypothetical protein
VGDGTKDIEMELYYAEVHELFEAIEDETLRELNLDFLITISNSII